MTDSTLLPRRFPAALLLALVLAAVLRLGVWAGYRDSPAVIVTGDTHSYWKPAINLLRFGVFSRSDEPPFEPSLARTPVYPVFLGLCTLVFHGDLDSLAPMADRAHAMDFDPVLIRLAREIVLVQIVLSLIALTLVWLIGAPLWGRTAAAFAVLLLALDIPTAICVNNVMSEALFCALLVLVVFLAARRGDDPSRGALSRPVVLGLSTGVLALCRPVALYYFVFLAPFLFFRAFPKGRRLAGSILFLIAALSLPGAWVCRNWVRVGTPVFCSIGAINLYEYRAAWNQARIEGRQFDELKAEFEERTRAEGGKTEAERIRFMKREGFRILLSHPGLTALQGFQGLVKMAFGISNSGLDYLWKSRDDWSVTNSLNDPGAISSASIYRWVFKGCPPWVAALKIWSALHILLLYVGIGAALARYRKASERWGPGGDAARNLAVLCLLTIGYFLLVSVGAEANSRFRVPIAPALCLIAGLGWSELLRLGRRRN